jgi:arylsulfatase A-like enzyme
MPRGCNRRTFLRTAAAGAVALSAMGHRATGTGAKRRKLNLLFIWTDEQRADTMAVYGNTKIRAPNLNKLAGESIVFEKAYVTQPVCTPSRSSVMTGLWPHTNGCTANNIPLRRETSCLPELLADQDYRTAYMGKWHLGDEIFAQHGFQEWVSMEDGYSQYFTPGHDRNARSDYHHFLLELGYKPESGGRFSREYKAKLPIQHCKPAFLESRACNFLRRHRNDPFVLYVNFLEPHMPFFGPLDKEHDPEQVLFPATFNGPFDENEPLRYRINREYCRVKYGNDEQAFRKLIARYYGLVTQVDRSVGAILKALDDLGLSDHTIVVYTSDHGDMMGAHRLVEKSVMYEEAVRVPLLMRVPQLAPQERMIRRPISHIDLVPTLLDLMGHQPEKDLPGQSLASMMQTGKLAQDHVFIEWHSTQEALRRGAHEGNIAPKERLDRVARERTRTVIAPDGWKLCLSDLDKCQLFNLRDDPGETQNLFYAGGHRDVINRLAGRIRQWQRQVQDTVELPA